MLRLNQTYQELTKDTNGCAYWQSITQPIQARPTQTAIIVCDMWDKHWSHGANLRVEAMVGRMNDVVHIAREHGVLIIHAPSDTLDFYANTPARQRAMDAPVVVPPEPLERDEPPLPIDDSDGGSDTGETSWYKAWSRQHPAIAIDHAVDAISDDGRQIYNLLVKHDIQQVLLMGVHTNMCILNRSFGIKQMVRWGVPIALVHDLTDTMYNPAKPPYVSHAEGTALVIGYIERFWCPTVDSRDIA
ncbi:MAG: isochorismatase [Chloroflexota bacterium]